MPLGDRRPEPVQVGEGTPILVRHEQPHVLETVREELRDAVAEGGEALSRRAEIWSARGKAFPMRCATERVEEVYLVQDELDRDVVGADLARTDCTAPIVSLSRSSPSDASTTWSTRSATSVSSSVAAKPSTSSSADAG